MNWIKKILGITELIKEQKKTNELLGFIVDNTGRMVELQEKRNNHYHIR